MCHSSGYEPTVPKPPILEKVVEYDVPVNPSIDCNGIYLVNSYSL